MEDWEREERIYEEGEVLLHIDCLVDSSAGSGFSRVLLWDRQYFLSKDYDGLTGPYASFDDACRDLPLMIHTAGEWTFSGPMAEAVLPRIVVCDLTAADPPFVVSVNEK